MPTHVDFSMNKTSDIHDLAARLERYNAAYRLGAPEISDAEYDQLTEELRALDPEHPFLQRVEPEEFSGRIEVRHPRPMLSTEKAYTQEELARFVARVRKEAGEIGVEDPLFRVTPKLDGLAGRDDGEVFVTRGNGEVGYEVSSAFIKGMVPVGGRGLGVGEMVVSQSYFDAHLAEKFEHPRNLVVGIVSADTVNEDARRALEAGAVRFVPYATLPKWEGNGDALVRHMAEISADLAAQMDYPLDGMVAEAVDEDVQRTMGATNHHYRWQIAVKRKGDTARTTVEDIVWQVGRTGKVTPVLQVTAVSLSGATIRRVTAHNAGFLEKNGLGAGAEIEIIRSGEVIPKVEDVVFAVAPDLPTHCPSCAAELVREGDFLLCTNIHCPAQAVQALEHWFKTLGTADWFGRKTIERIVAAGYDELEQIYELGEEDFRRMEFGPVQSSNLAEAVYLSRTKPVEDWRFLAALGIEGLGTGDSRRLLENFRLEELPELKTEQIKAIHGFGEITAQGVVTGMKRRGATLRHMLDLGFQIIPTGAAAPPPDTSSPLVGKHVVFTGKMAASREAMQEQARALGALVQKDVNAKTDYLICGANVGAAKIAKARQLGTQILTEEEYLRLIRGAD
jgi:DNA ligase (NAD+)